eukprot:366184-Chlamydomonas_euryale.AAC.7
MQLQQLEFLGPGRPRSRAKSSAAQMLVPQEGTCLWGVHNRALLQGVGPVAGGRQAIPPYQKRAL